MREKYGHYSPGPQYSIPGTMGGAAANANAATERLATTNPAATFTRLASAAMPYTSLHPPTQPGSNGAGCKLTATQLGGTANFVMTSGSFADHTRPGGTGAVSGSTEYWRSATMLQPKEPDFHNSGPRPHTQQRWHMTEDQARDTREQDAIKQSLRERSRPDPKAPRRQTADFRSDPPNATVFGSGHAHSEFGKLGGLEGEWRESKVAGYKSTGPKMGPSTGPLRYAFVQPKGPNSVPKGASKANFDGDRRSYLPADGSMPRSAKSS